MKRDMELIRQILLAVEAWPPGGGDYTFPELGRDAADVEYSKHQARRSGLIDGLTLDPDIDAEAEGPFTQVYGLTPAGHDFLDQARNPYVWDEAMAAIRDRGFRDASIDIIKGLLDKFARKRLGLDS